jgi:alginate O-acetyltransferase complex protein AlgI
MQLLSAEFLCFLAVIAILSRLLPARAQCYLLLAASYIFYFTWDIRMAVGLLFLTTVVYCAGLLLRHVNGRVTGAVAFTTIALLTLYLVSFKLRLALHPETGLVIPLGISYYTFRLLSYLLDVFWKKIEPERDFVAFAAYVAFFPQLVAGPIQRPASFLEQLGTTTNRGRVFEGLMRMALGFAKKSLVADNLNLFVTSAYAHLSSGSALPSVVAFYLYPLQLYADFSGLTDIAIGAGLVLGIEGPENFNSPFSASSITEFWRRWNMTLTGWIRDYVFMPLRMVTRNWGKAGLCFSLVVNMLLIALWHGFSFGFLLYGIFHSICLIADTLTASSRKRLYVRHTEWSAIASFVGPVLVYHVVAFGSVLFRAPSFPVMGTLLAGFAVGLQQIRPAFDRLIAPPNHHAWVALPAFLLLELADAFRRRYSFRLPALATPRWAEWSAYACVSVLWVLIAVTLLATEKGANPFVYALF